MKKLRRFLSVLLVFSMLMSMCQIAFAGQTPDPLAAAKAEQQEKQIEGDSNGSPVYYTWNNGQFAKVSTDTDPKMSTPSGKVNVSKSIAPTGTENLFDITLEVETTEQIDEITSSPAAAVVVVIDNSSSMEQCADCRKDEAYHHVFSDTGRPGVKNSSNDGKCDVAVGTGWDGKPKYCDKTANKHVEDHSYVSCLEAAKTAAKAFLTSYVDGANGADRYASIVIFDANASIKTDWVNIGTGENQTPLASVFTDIDAITLGSGTNTDGGLYVAEGRLANCPADSQNGHIDNRFVVLLTDGEPYKNNGEGTKPVENSNGYRYPAGYTKKTGDSRANYNYPALRAGKIRAAESDNGYGAKLFSVAFGEMSGSGETWLSSFSDKCVRASSAAGLVEAFSKIAALIKLAAEAWTVSDPMGSFINIEAVPANRPVTVSAEAGGKETLTWNLRGEDIDDISITTDKSGVTHVTYDLTYRVRLDVPGILNDSNADIKDYFKTNGRTTLTYTLTKKDDKGEIVGYYKENGTDLITDDTNPGHVVDFKVPAVKGYAAALSFVKQGYKLGQLANLAGAKFTLTSERKTSDGTTPIISFDRTSDTSGAIEYAAIPSGEAYTLTETAVPAGFTAVAPVDFAVSYGEKVFENGQTLGASVIDPIEIKKTSKDLTKTWFVPGEATESSITVTLWRSVKNGEKEAVPKYKDFVISKDDSSCKVEGNKWTYTFTDLDETDGEGNVYTYTATEASMTGYRADYGKLNDVALDSSLSISNTAVGTTTITVTKDWILPEGYDTTSLPKAKLSLMAGGDNKGTFELGYKETKTFADMPMYDAGGKTIVYTVTESAGSYQYVKTVQNGYDFTVWNTVTDAKRDVSGKKTWVIGSDEAPASIQVKLLRDGKEFTDETIQTAAEVTGDSWTYEFKDLPKYEFTYEQDGNTVKSVREYVYSVKEVGEAEGLITIDGISYNVAYDQNNNITNTRTGLTDFTVYKEWEDVPGSDHSNDLVTVKLLANGKEVTDSKGEPVTAIFAGSYKFENLSKYDEKGAVIKYSVTEEPVTGFAPSYSTVTAGVYEQTVTNTKILDDDDTVTVTIEKQWQQPADAEDAEASFTVTGTLADCEDTEIAAAAVKTYTKTIEGDGTDSSKYPKYYKYTDTTTGETVFYEYTYTVEETDAPENYEMTSGGKVENTANNWKFVNTITGDTTVTVNKSWGSMPEDVNKIDVVFNVMTGDTKVGEISIKAGETSGSLSVPKYDANGQTITYTVAEQKAANFTGTVTPKQTSDGSFEFDAVNTLDQSNMSLTVNKVWNDDSRDPAERPEVSLTLTNAGTVTFSYDKETGAVMAAVGDEKSVVDISEDHNTYSYTFKDLPVYTEDRSAYVSYTLSESDLSEDGYAAEISNLTAINTRSAMDDIKITKYWVDPEDSVRPEIELDLSGDGKTCQVIVKDGKAMLGDTELELEEVDRCTWNITVPEMPVYDADGKFIEYTLTEKAVDGYDTYPVEGQLAVKNVIKQEYVKAGATKTWEGMDTTGVYTPEYPDFIEVALYCDGVRVEGSEKSVVRETVEEGVFAYTITDYEDLDKYDLVSGKVHVYEVKELDPYTNEAVENNGTVTFSENNCYVVSYGEDGAIVNTFTQPQKYMYIITRHFTHYNFDGSIISEYSLDGDMITLAEAQTVAADPEGMDEEGTLYKYCPIDRNTYNFDDADETNVLGAEVEEPNTLYRLVINYVLTEKKPDDPVSPHRPRPKDPVDPVVPEVPVEPEVPEEPEVVEVPEDDVPLAEMPDAEEPLDIFEEEVPLADVPATGDNTALWLTCFIFSTLALGVLNLLKRKDENYYL